MAESPDNPPADRTQSFASRVVMARYGAVGDLDKPLGPMLRLTRQQRDLLRQGLLEVRPMFLNGGLWDQAFDEIETIQTELELPGLLVAFEMWTSSLAAMAMGSWWLLMPGCGPPRLQEEMCRQLSESFWSLNPRFEAARDFIEESPNAPAVVELLDRIERVRCMLVVHVR